MKEVTVTATKKGQPEYEATYSFPETLDEAIAQFGADVCLSHVNGSVKIALQGAMRRGIDAGKNDAEVQMMVKSWKPTLASQRTGKTAKEKFMATFAKMTKEDQQAIIDRMLAEATAGAAPAEAPAKKK